MIIEKGGSEVTDRLINSAVLRRIQRAESEGDIGLLEKHLKSNYDVEIHNAVRAALMRLGQQGIHK